MYKNLQESESEVLSIKLLTPKQEVIEVSYDSREQSEKSEKEKVVEQIKPKRRIPQKLTEKNL